MTTIGTMRSDAAQQFVRGVLLDPDRPRDVRKRAVRLLGARRSGTLALLEMAEAGELPQDLTFDASSATHASPHEDIRLMAEQLLPREETREGEKLPPANELLAMNGDAARGRIAFFAEDRS